MEVGLKFFCDEQLGKLSRWLRIIGQDSVWERRISDEALLSRARAEGRVVLTRDRKLAEKAEGVRVVCLSENYPALQLREVVAQFQDQIRLQVFSRCVICNVELTEVSKKEVAGLVPPFVFATQERFTQCPTCGRVFWKATHYERVELALQQILGEMFVENKEKSEGRDEIDEKFR